MMAEEQVEPPEPDRCSYSRIAEEQLCEEDYQTLPDTMKAYDSRAQNEFLNVTPSVLKFPHDDPSKHFVKLVIWNKSKQAVDFSIQQPNTGFFSIFYDKTHLFAGTEATVIVRCMPKGQRICSDCIRIIMVNRPESDVIVIPLELLPSSKWFVLPKVVVMPVIPIGRCYDIIIPLPEPPMTEEALYFHVKGGNTETITVHPSEGCIGSQPSATVVYTGFLTVTYHPREYCTFSHIFSLNFSQLENMMPYEITVHCRCIPGYETEIILESINLLQIPAELNQPVKKPKLPRSTLKSIEKPVVDQDSEPAVPNLSTTAAVMKFLMTSTDKAKPFAAAGGAGAHPLGVNDPEHRNQYKRMEMDFHDRLTRISIAQESIHLKHTRAFLGEEAFHDDADASNVRAERELAMHEYQRTLGLEDDNVEDMNRTKLMRSNQRCIRDLDTNYFPEETASLTKFQFLSINMANPQRWAKLEKLHRFIQAARLIITRKRADKRIVKLRVLIKETLMKRKAEATEQLRLAEVARLEHQKILPSKSVVTLKRDDSHQSGLGLREPLPIGDTATIAPTTGKKRRRTRTQRHVSSPGSGGDATRR